MDEAWELEEAYWQAGLEGRVADYYSRVLASDAFVVTPGRLYPREELIRLWAGIVAWTSFSITERHGVLVNGETVLLSYLVEAPGTDGTHFSARVSSLYTWVGGGWVMVFRQYTEQPTSTMEFTDEAVAKRTPAGQRAE